MLKKLFSHTFIYGISPQIVKVAQFAALPIITPHLTARDYGVFGLITAVVGAASIFANLGLNVVLANSFVKSTHQFKWLWRQIYGFLILWSFLYAFVVGVVVYMFIPDEARSQTWLIILLNILPLLLFSPSTNIGMLYYQLIGKPTNIVVRSIIIGLITVGLNIYLIRDLQLGFIGWFWSGAISQVLYQLSYFVALRYGLNINPIYNFKWKTIVKQVKICLPSIPHYYSSYVLNAFDKIIMNRLGLSTFEIGRYNASQIPANLFSTAALAANQAAGPLLLDTYKRDDRTQELRINYSIMTGFLTLTTIVCLFMRELLPMVVKSVDMVDIYPVAIILIMGYNYRPMYVASNNRLFYNEKTKGLLKITSVAAILSIVLNFFFISRWGIHGAAASLFISFMYMGYSGFYVSEFKEGNGTNHNPLIWLLLTVLLTVFVYFAVELDIVVKLLLSIVFLLIGLLILFFMSSKYKLKA